MNISAKPVLMVRSQKKEGVYQERVDIVSFDLARTYRLLLGSPAAPVWIYHTLADAERYFTRAFLLTAFDRLLDEMEIEPEWSLISTTSRTKTT